MILTLPLLNSKFHSYSYLVLLIRKLNHIFLNLVKRENPKLNILNHLYDII
jgi:hypothetical protein